ncbi:hypothetical protein [Streptomyces sp. NPDC101393]|uniref:hypothetical protein n=1 Tax=Streptomyces sp. NPDC101393 TaxID=3366141 RepID=UPI00381535C6
MPSHDGRQSPAPSRTGEITSPTLPARLRDLHDRREAALAEVPATASGGPGDITPRAAAALLGTAHRALFPRIQELTPDGRDNAEIATVVPEEAARAFDLLEPSLADYAAATA